MTQPVLFDGEDPADVLNELQSEVDDLVAQYN